MTTLNKVFLIGRLGKDPETKTLTNTQVTNFSLATTEKQKDTEITTWHNIVCLGKLAEISAKYLAKGRQCFIEGRIQTRSWEKDGVKQYRTEILASHITFLEKASDKGQEQRDPFETKTHYGQLPVNIDDISF